MTTAGTLYDALQNVGYGGGLLQYVSAGQIKFIPCGGNAIRINGQWFQIPAAGITGINTSASINGTPGLTLAANTFYYVYLFNNAGTPTIDFSTTGHATSSAANNAGTEIKTGDESRSLIGMVRTEAGGIFFSDRTKRQVRSWFNRQAEPLSMSRGYATANQFQTSSLTFVAWSSFAPFTFLTWQDELVSVSIISSAFNTAGYPWEVTYWWDGAATSIHHTARNAESYGNWMTNGGYGEHKMLSEGYHTLQPAVRQTLAGGVGFTCGGGGPGVFPLMTARIN